jgi:tRNA threonylcarbamoyladenosine biosynthesis protein TsaE
MGIETQDTSIIGALQRSLPDAEATARAGAALALGLCRGMIVTVAGNLGAGKTTLVRGMLRQMGWAGPVKSPSYALVEHYLLSSLYFYHFDFYRFNDCHEWDATGFAELFRADTVCVIEWPERIAGRLPTVDIAAHLSYAEPGRALLLRAATAAGKACLARFSATAA